MNATEIALIIGAVTGSLGTAIAASVKAFRYLMERERAIAMNQYLKEQADATVNELKQSLLEEQERSREWEARYDKLWKLMEGLTA